MQHCDHVAAYYWHRYNAFGVSASMRNGFALRCSEYGQAAKCAYAAKFLR